MATTGTVLKTFDASGFVLTHKAHRARSRLDEHAHDSAVFCFVLRGSYVESHERGHFACRPSTLTFRPAGEPHRNEFHRSDVEVLTVDVPSHWWDRAAQASMSIAHSSSFRDCRVTQLAQRVASEFERMDFGAALMLEGLSIELLAAAARHGVEPRERAVPAWLRRACELIRAQFAEHLSLGMIAVEVGVHPVHLAAVFRRKYGCTIGEYVRQLRIERACRELVTTDHALARIALDAGFANHGHFSTAFKRATGSTPRAYRRRHARP